MRGLYVVIAILVSAIVVFSFAVLDKGFAQPFDCPSGQAPVVGEDGNQLKDASGNPQCSPIDAFNNLFGK
jgi:hypothetical protein